MRRRGSDQVGRWPWGTWLALVGVSAGTVASFAAVGWVFLHAAGFVDSGGDSRPLAWDRDGVVIETDETAGGDREPGGDSGTDDAEPTPWVLAAPEPQAATVTAEEEPAEPEPELVVDAAEIDPLLMPTEPEPSAEELALVPLDPFLSHAPAEDHPSTNASSELASPSEQLILK